MAPLQVFLRRRQTPGEAASPRGAAQGTLSSSPPTDQQLKDALNNLLLTVSVGEGASVISYGSWGSGKSHALGTLLPTTSHPPGPDLLSMAVSCIFSLLGEGGSISISCVEILGSDEHHDLLDSGQPHGGPTKQLLLRQESERLQRQRQQLSRNASSRRFATFAGPSFMLRSTSMNASGLQGQCLAGQSFTASQSFLSRNSSLARSPSIRLTAQSSFSQRGGAMGRPGDEGCVQRASTKVLQVQALASAPASSPEEAHSLLQAALKRRLTSSTAQRPQCHLGHVAIRLTWTPPGAYASTRVSHSSQLSALTGSMAFSRAPVGSLHLGSCSSLSSSFCSSMAASVAPTSCTLTLLDCCSQMAAVCLPSDRVASGAKRALLSLGKSLSHAPMGEQAMALRESHLTRALIGSVNQIMLLACLGGTLDTPIPASGVTAPSGAPPSPAAVAAASDNATLHLVKDLLQGNRWQLVRAEPPSTQQQQHTQEGSLHQHYFAQQQQQQQQQFEGSSYKQRQHEISEQQQQQQQQRKSVPQQQQQGVAQHQPQELGTEGSIVLGPSTPEQSAEREQHHRLSGLASSLRCRQPALGDTNRSRVPTSPALAPAAKPVNRSRVPPPPLVLPPQAPQERYGDMAPPATPSPSSSYASVSATPESTSSRSPGAGLRPRWLPASRIPKAPAVSVSTSPPPINGTGKGPKTSPGGLPLTQQPLLIRGAALFTALPKPSSPSRLPPRYKASPSQQPRTSAGLATPPKGPRPIRRLSSAGSSPQPLLQAKAAAAGHPQHTAHLSTMGSFPRLAALATLPALVRTSAAADDNPDHRSRSALSGCILPSDRHRQHLEQQYQSLLADFASFTNKPGGRFRSPSPSASGPAAQQAPGLPTTTATHACAQAVPRPWASHVLHTGAPIAAAHYGSPQPLTQGHREPAAASVRGEAAGDGDCDDDLFSWPLPTPLLLSTLPSRRSRPASARPREPKPQRAPRGGDASAKVMATLSKASGGDAAGAAGGWTATSSLCLADRRMAADPLALTPVACRSLAAHPASSAADPSVPAAAIPMPQGHAVYSRIPSLCRPAPPAPEPVEPVRQAANMAAGKQVKPASYRADVGIGRPVAINQHAGDTHPTRPSPAVARTYALPSRPVANRVDNGSVAGGLAAGKRPQAVQELPLAGPGQAVPRVSVRSLIRAFEQPRQVQALARNQPLASRIPARGTRLPASAPGPQACIRGGGATPKHAPPAGQSSVATSFSSTCSELVGASLLVDKSALLSCSALSLAAVPADARLLPLPKASTHSPPPLPPPLPPPHPKCSSPAPTGPIPRKMSFAEWEKESSLVLMESQSLPALLMDVPLRERYCSAQLPDWLMAGPAQEPLMCHSPMDSPVDRVQGLGYALDLLDSSSCPSPALLKAAMADHEHMLLALRGCGGADALIDLDRDANVLIGAESEEVAL